MKKIEILFLLFFVFSCTTSENKDKVETIQENTQDNKSKDSFINDPRSPNPSSELAVLMRDMWEYTDTLKTNIVTQNTTALPDYRSRFAQIHTALPTDEHTKSPAFDAMAKIMLQKLENVYQNSKKEQSVQVEGFNLLVKSCLQCHEQQCPGPVSKISKLMITKE